MTRKFAAILLLLIPLASLLPRGEAQDPKPIVKKAAATGEGGATGAPADGGEPALGSQESRIPTELADAAFDRYADLTDIRQTVLDRDAAGVLDAALLLAEGERVLFRQRKGITADHLLKLALSLAAEQGDQATLKRLDKAARSLGHKDLADRAAGAVLLARPARSADPTAGVTDADPAVAAYLRECLIGIEQARLVGNDDALKQLDEALATADHLTDARKKSLKAAVAAARQNLGATPAADDPVAKLLAGSRGWQIGPVKGDWPPKLGGREKKDLHRGSAGDVKITLHNNSKYHIWVALGLYESPLAGTTFTVKKWTALKPGEKTLVKPNNRDQGFLVYAETNDTYHNSRVYWRGGATNTSFADQGRTLRFVGVQMGNVAEYTYKFNN